MNWFRQNRFLGGFLVALGLATLLSLCIFFRAKAAADAGEERLHRTIAELTRLRASAPFPNEDNLRKTRAQTAGYRSSLLALESELKKRMFPRPPLQPSEFQAMLRQTEDSMAERARAARVQLPGNFHLGFDEYATSLPNGLAAPRLGQQLRAIEWLVNTLIAAHADALTGLSRSPLPEEKGAASPTPISPGVRRGPAAKTEEKIVAATSLDLAFAGSPTAVRRVLNQIAAAQEQFYILRTLQVKNQSEKGPRRGSTEATPPPANAPGAPTRAAEPPISFIVGTEHLNVTARIEILRFNFAPEEAR